MSIKNWPIEDRPSEKLLKIGSNQLTDAELLAIFIKTGTRDKTALDIAKELIQQHGSLASLLQQPRSTLLQTAGIGVYKYVQLQAACELGRRNKTPKHDDKQPINSTALAQSYLSSHLAHQRSEVFACLFLDSHLRLIRFEILFWGTINSAPIYPREILRKALEHNAAKLILAHNHPSGNPKPSQADKDMTLIMQQAVGFFDIELVDHIIIGHGENYSFASEGLI